MFRRMVWGLVTVFSFGSLGAMPLQAQQAGATEAAPPITIRTATHLVLIDVVAVDNQGKPVTGLR